MLDVLNGAPLLVLLVVVALGAMVGAIPFGTIRFGAAGALFVGLVVGAVIPGAGPQLALLQDFGLALFAYLIGLSAGKSFFRDLVKQAPLMAGSVVVIIVTAVAAVLGGRFLGMDPAAAVGVFSGALTSTPSMALAQDIDGTTLPAVGYSISYLFGVILAILIVAVVGSRQWKATRDPAPASGEDLVTRTIRVTRSMAVSEIEGVTEGRVRVAAARRGQLNRIARPTDELVPGNLVELVGTAEALNAAVLSAGEPVTKKVLSSARGLQARPFIVSAPDIAEQTLGSLNLYREYGATVTRVRRGDAQILAADDIVLNRGDAVMVIAPTWRMSSLQSFFGHSTRSLSDIDWVPLGLGLAFGYALALLNVPLPGGNSFVLGSAAGTLIAGLLVGAVGRSGKVIWQIPQNMNLILRQFGLMLFLGAVGLASGPAFMDTVFTPLGLQSLILAVIVSVVGCGLMALATWMLRQSAERASGAVAGLLGQPAVLDFATSRSADARVMSGYAQIFAIALLVKIAVVPFMM